MKILLAGAVSILAVSAQGGVLAPYVADANTTYLYHLDESSGSTFAANQGTAGYKAVAFDGNPYAGLGVGQPTATSVLGAAAYPGFGAAANIGAADLGLGVDVNNDGLFDIDHTDTTLGRSRDNLSDHSTIFGASNAFTVEANINLSAITGSNREIVCTDTSLANADRGFQFRVNSTGNLEFNFIGVNTSSVSTPVPTTGDQAFVANQWFHVALVYNGTQAQFYWTKVGSAVTGAVPTGALLTEAVDINDDAIIVLGNEARNTGSGVNSAEGLLGLIDEVRISNVARTPQEMIPEPASSALLGIAGLALVRRRKIG